MVINKNLMSRNHTLLSRSKEDIKFIVMHYVGALGDAKANTDYYKSYDVGASADFWVGHYGDVWQGNDFYDAYSWHCGGGNAGKFFGVCTNKNSIGIEMCVKKRSTATMLASDRDWYFDEETVKSAAELVRSLMKELNIDVDHVIRHHDVNGKICPNPFVYDETAWNNFKKSLVEPSEAQECIKTATTYEDMKKLSSDAERAEKLLEIATPICKSYGLFPSVITAMCCLESGFGCTTELSKSNNIIGIKANLVNSEWTGSSWDGKSTVIIHTPEYYNGKLTYIDDYFRAYPCIEDGMRDVCAFFTTMTKYVEGGILEAENYTEQLTVISRKGWATDPSYIEKTCRIVRSYNLDKNDHGVEQTQKVWYRVGTDWKDGACVGQIEADEVLDNAKKTCDKHPGTKVFDMSGKVLYENTLTERQQKIETACAWAKKTAADDTHGYNNSYPVREGDYNCIKLVYDAYAEAGIQCNYISCWDADVEFIRAGFIEADVDFNDIKTLEKGDILWRSRHVALYTGENERTEACGDFDGIANSDSSGNEIVTHAYANDGWMKCFRLPEDKTVNYRVQTGAFHLKLNANARKKLVKKKSGFDSFVEKEKDSFYHVYTGSFAVKANAEERAKLIEDATGLKTLIKEA